MININKFIKQVTSILFISVQILHGITPYNQAASDCNQNDRLFSCHSNLHNICFEPADFIISNNHFPHDNCHFYHCIESCKEIILERGINSGTPNEKYFFCSKNFLLSIPVLTLKKPFRISEKISFSSLVIGSFTYRGPPSVK